jgi:hypothetical protein
MAQIAHLENLERERAALTMIQPEPFNAEAPRRHSVNTSRLRASTTFGATSRCQSTTAPSR